MSTIDIVIPCYNDSRSLIHVLKQLDKLFNQKACALIIDNGSKHPIAQDIKKSFKAQKIKVKVIRLASNVGYESAIYLGLKMSKSKYTAEIDGDNEDPPADLYKMFELLKKNKADCIYGVRIKRETKWYMQFCYKAFYRIYRFLSENKVEIDAGEFAIYTNKIRKRIIQCCDSDYFIRGARSLAAGKQIPYPYKRNKRYDGITKFNFFGAFDLAMDGFLFNTKKPLRFFTFLGATVFAITGLIITTNVVLKLLNNLLNKNFNLILPDGLTQTSLIIFILLMINFIMLIIIGEYTLKTLSNARKRNNFFVERIDIL
jgi:dolichol-phosphate mannosyltransferase